MKQFAVKMSESEYEYIKNFLFYLDCDFSVDKKFFKSKTSYLVYGYKNIDNLIGVINYEPNKIYLCENIDQFLHLISAYKKRKFEFYKNKVVNDWYTIKTEYNKKINDWVILNNGEFFICYCVNDISEQPRYFSYIKKFYKILEIKAPNNIEEILKGEKIYNIKDEIVEITLEDISKKFNVPIDKICIV